MNFSGEKNTSPTSKQVKKKTSPSYCRICLFCHNFSNQPKTNRTDKQPAPPPLGIQQNLFQFFFTQAAKNFLGVWAVDGR